MVFVRYCCCGISLRKASFAICCWTLTTEILTLSLLMNGTDNQATRSILLGSKSSEVRYMQVWTSLLNLFVIIIALYGIHKKRAPLLIPYLAYRIVTTIFFTFTLLNVRQIANSVNETMENSLHNERDQTFDSWLLVLCIMFALIGLDVYFLLVVQSYYQSLMIRTRVVAVTLPVAAYTTASSGRDNLESMYSQPATNPYLIADGKIPSPPQYDPYVPTYGYPYYGPPYGGRSSMANLPPPYRP